VIFTDDSYFETGDLRMTRAKGVLRRAGEAYIPRNINRKFGTGATIMFWGAILYDHSGNQLPYHLYKTPYETAEERRRADVQLQEEYEQELREEAFHLANGDWLAQDPELKVRKKDRKGGIDWFIYRERILNPQLYPFVLQKMAQRPGVLLMEDNAPSHIHHYHNYPREQLGINKLIWPPNSPDLNPIERIWMEIKDKIKSQIGVDFTAAAIRRLLLQEWTNYPVDRVNHHVLSMTRRIEACIADGGGNNFNF
jgi:transposase